MAYELSSLVGQVNDAAAVNGRDAMWQKSLVALSFDPEGASAEPNLYTKDGSTIQYLSFLKTKIQESWLQRIAYFKHELWIF